MSDPQSRRQPDAGDAWQEVGKQFQRLGQSLATAFQTTVKDETTRQNMRELQDGLENAIQGIRSTVQKGASALEEQNFGEKARQTADSLIDAGEQTVEEVRPRLLSALQQLNRELDRLIHNMQSKPSGEEKPDN